MEQLIYRKAMVVSKDICIQYTLQRMDIHMEFLGPSRIDRGSL
jgi:hypothetical protein